MTESRIKKIISVICLLMFGILVYFAVKDNRVISVPPDCTTPPAIDWRSPVFFP